MDIYRGGDQDKSGLVPGIVVTRIGVTVSSFCFGSNVWGRVLNENCRVGSQEVLSPSIPLQIMFIVVPSLDALRTATSLTKIKIMNQLK